MEPATPESPRSAGLPGLRILLAEDTPSNQRLVSRVLERLGHRVEIAQDGRQALDCVCRGQFDLVLMDVLMPHLDGFQAAAAIRALPDAHKARVPIVILTARDAPDDAERCRAAGLDDYLAKPLDVRQLAQLVGRFPPRSSAAG